MNAGQGLVFFFGVVLAIYMNVDAQEPKCSCVTVKCADRNVTAEECKKLGGIHVPSESGCCDSCEKYVREGESCQGERGVFPKPVCDPGQSLYCIRGFCVKI